MPSLRVLFSVVVVCGVGAAGTNARADEPFGLERVREMAQQLAAKPQVPPARVAEPFLKLNYDTYRLVAPRHDHPLWGNASLPFRAEFFAAGYIFEYPVELYEVAGGAVRPIQFGDEWYQFRGAIANLAHQPGGGFSGFRLLGRLPANEQLTEFFVFQGASYFRAIGAGQNYGASSRGLAIDIGLGSPEEFPRFRKFWLEKPEPGATQTRVWALVDSPAVAGAYEFIIRPGEASSADVDAHLWFRHGVQKLGIAPLTSMWMWDEAMRPGDAHRPEVHDSDGLLVENGADWTWRPLGRPEKTLIQTITADQVAGFGLLQRDRDYTHYRDDEAKYHLRPSVWVTPIGDWGTGHVELFELPSHEEGTDNINAYWVSDEPARGGQYRHFSYRIAFGKEPAQPNELLRVTDTRFDDSPASGAMVEIRFAANAAGKLDKTPRVDSPQPVAKCDGGTIQDLALRALPEGGYTLTFRYSPAAKGENTAQAYLTLASKRISETWTYRWLPK